MKELVNQVIKEYNECLAIDNENTDSLFFCLDEVGTDNDLTDDEFQQLSDLVQKEIE